MKFKPLLAGLLLGALGFAGNWFKYELFFNVDFLFGTFFVMLALLRFGALAAIIAGVIASTCTWLLWNHPWAIVIFSAEAVVVAWLHEKRRINLTTSMALYWASLGPLLVWLFYHQVMAIPIGATWLIILKQAINAVMNALLAKVFHLALSTAHPVKEKKLGYREYIATLMLALVLFPALLYIVIEIRSILARHLEDANRRASHTCRLTRTTVDEWVSNNHDYLKVLALSIGDPQRIPAAEMQRLAEAFLESAKQTYLRMGVINRDSISVAYAPPVDATGKSTIGLNFSDRPYLSIVRDQKLPYVGNVQISRVSPPQPEVVLLAPMVWKGEYTGFCGGILDLSPLNAMLREIVGPRNLVITLLDRNGAVITSTGAGREMMKPWPRGEGEIQRVSETVFQWLPAPKKGIALMQRWRNSYFFSESVVSPAIGWTVVVEAPLLPAMNDLTRATTDLFGIMAGLILVMTILSHLVSRAQSRPIVSLQNLTEQVASHPERPVDQPWPTSPIREVEALSRNFQLMAGSLREQITKLQDININLESLVRERTEEIRKTSEEAQAFFNLSPDLLCIADQDGHFLKLNPHWEKTLGFTVDEMTGRPFTEFVHPDDIEATARTVSLAVSETITNFTNRYRTKTGDYRWIEWHATHSGRLIFAAARDVTDRQKFESALRQAEQRYRTLFEQSPFGVLLFDIEARRIIDFNDVACRQLGYTRSEFAHMWISDWEALESPEAIQAHVDRVLRNGRDEFETRHRTRTGDIRTVRITVQTLELDEHTLVYAIYQDITELRVAEHALRESEERFRSLFEKVHVVAMVIDPSDGSIADANAAACSFYGWNCEELLGMKISDINTLSPEQVQQEMTAALEERRSYFNFQHRRADGSIRDVEVYSGPIPISGKTLLYSIVHDVTDKKQAEDRIRELQQEQELILSTAPIGILYVKNREIVWTNSAFKKTFGYEEEELRGRSTVILYSSREQFEEIGREGYAVVARGVTFSRDFVTMKKDGTRFWVNLIGRAIDPRDVQKGSIWMFQDITERKQAEDELSRREQQYRNLVEHSSVWIWETDENIRHVYTNAMVEDLLGYTVDEFLRTDIFTLVHEGDHEKLRAIVDRAIGNREPWRSVVMRWRHRNGSWRHFESSGTPFFAPDGRLLGLRGVDQDVTVRLMAEEALRELNRNLEARVEAETRLRLEQERMLVQQSKMAAMGEMIGAIAHQWRQPLNAVGIIVQDIREAFGTGRLDQPYLRQAVSDTMDQIQFMSRTIEDFRNFFRPDKEQTDFDLKQAVAGVLSIVSGQLQSHGITWLVTCRVHGRSFRPGDRIETCGEMVVRGYENELKQVFLNLIDNAKDSILDHRARLERKEEGLIRIDFDRDGKRVIVRISDNGGGIPEPVIDRIFEPYFSTKEQGRGTGIGLYMCKMIIEKNMGGRISARNTGGGAEFRVEIEAGNP